MTGSGTAPDPTAHPAIGAIADEAEASTVPASDASAATEARRRFRFLRLKSSDLISLISALVAAGSLLLSIISAGDAEESAARATQVATDALAAMQTLAKAAERSADAAEAAAERQERIAAASVRPSPQFRTRGDMVSLSMTNDGVGPAHIAGMFFRLADNGVEIATDSYFLPDFNGATASTAFQKIVTRHRDVLVRQLPHAADATIRAYIFLGDLAIGAEQPLLWAEGHPEVADEVVFRSFEPLMMAACTCNTFSDECSLILSAAVPEGLAAWTSFHDKCLKPQADKHDE